MKLVRLTLASAALLAVAGLAYVAQEARPAGADMAAAAAQFLDSLTTEQREVASYAFDSKERFNWEFVPLEKDGRPTRKGLALKDMTPEQKKSALALLKAGTSDAGNLAATTIMSLEEILKAQQTKGPTRNPEWYFFTVFGLPSKTAPWGFRVEGHHLSLNLTLEGTQVVSATPTFFGTNPAEVKSGPRKGLRVLEASEDRARELYKALDDGQKKAAYHAKAFPETKSQRKAPDVGDPVGLPAARLTAAQKEILLQLLRSYTARMPAEVGEAEMKRVRDAGLDRVHFAYNGATELGEPHTYRVQGPTFVVEFLNVQQDAAGNVANHVHSSWRHLAGDFGVDVLKKSGTN